VKKATGTDGLDAIREQQPRLDVLDVGLPDVDGLEVCRQLAGSSTRVVMVTTFDLDEYVARAIRYGACGFVLKRSRPELLVEAVHAAVDGDTLVSPQLTMRLLRSVRMNPEHPAHEAAGVLTPRELEVARLVAAGQTNIQIGRRLFITPGTVKTHLAKIQSKLGVDNRVGIAAWAWSTGVAGQEDLVEE
jgi:DNA-binding NarL/FixJ family response regulator